MHMVILCFGGSERGGEGGGKIGLVTRGVWVRCLLLPGSWDIPSGRVHVRFGVVGTVGELLLTEC